MAEGNGQDLIGLVATAFMQLGITAITRGGAEYVEDREDRSTQ